MPDKGIFVLADISGYTQYLDEAGLAHASKVTARLLNTLTKANRKRWRVANLEGDAVFFLSGGGEPPEQLIEHILHMFEAFFLHVLEIGEDTDCGCGACGAANQLALKFIVHAGEYAEQRVAGRREVAGSDVVVAHRLLKAGCPSPEYILLTLSYLGDRTLPGYHAETGSLELPSGAVPFVALDLAPSRRQLEVRHGVFVDKGRALASLETEVQASPGSVWETLLSSAALRLWTGAEVYSYPARMSRVGSVYRFVFSDGRDFAQVVLAFDEEGRRVTLRRSAGSFARHVYTTYEVSGREDGSARVSCNLAADTLLPSMAGLLSPPGMRDYKAEAETGLERLKAYCEAAAREGQAKAWPS